MIESIRSYLLSLVAAAMICSMALALSGNTKGKRVVRLACGLCIIVVLLGPLLHLKASDFSDYLEDLQQEADAAQTFSQDASTELTAQVITQSTEAYILDKAAAYGAEITVTVDVQAVGGLYSAPCGATITGSVTEVQKEALAQFMDETLGIPRDKQIWN